MIILELWRELGEKITKTRYTQALEAEVTRLRAENRAMLNSILGIAGVPPIPAQEKDVAAVREAAEKSPAAPYQTGNRQRSAGAQVATPLRRRSWHQINRMLEFQSAHQEQPAATNGSHGNLKTLGL